MDSNKLYEEVAPEVSPAKVLASQFLKANALEVHSQWDENQQRTDYLVLAGKVRLRYPTVQDADPITPTMARRYVLSHPLEFILAAIDVLKSIEEENETNPSDN